MNASAKILTITAMLATVAWFFWNPAGWKFQWEPIVVFLFALAGFVAAENVSRTDRTEKSAHPNDTVLFRTFLDALPSDSFIEFLKQHDFLLEFKNNRIAPLWDFLHEWDNAEHEFQDLELESLRKDLLKVASDFSGKVVKYTSPNRSGFQAVRVDDLKHIDEHEERFRKEAKIINTASDEFVRLHQELVRKGRKI